MSYSRDSNDQYRKRPRGSYSSSRNSDYGATYPKYRKFDQPIKNSEPNTVLRFSVWEARHEFTTNDVGSLFSAYGDVLRIVLFKKDGIPSGMVEMATLHGAMRAKQYLNGFIMYEDGSNKMQIEFAWTPTLFVVMNDPKKSWDFTPNYYQPAMPQYQPVYYDPYYQYQYQYQPQQVYQNYAAPPAVPQVYNAGFNENAMPSAQAQQAPQKYQNQNAQQPMIVFASTPTYQQNVLHISGLSYETSNPDKVFNLLSLYGNVGKVQFLRSRQGTALVQMFDSLSVECCMHHLHNVPIGSNGKLQICWASPKYFPSSSNQFSLSDGSRNYKDFTESKNQRFQIPRPATWIQPPSRIVRYYNIPASLTEKNIKELLQNTPNRVRALKMRNDEESGLSRGLLEFSSVAQAVLAVTKFNNKEIRSSKAVHFMKLCFSSSHSMDLKN